MFRVVTYNIRAGLGLDGMRSIRRIAEVLAPLNPDIVCLQEVDQHVPRSWLSNQPKFLGTRLGMQSVFQRNIKLGPGGFGNCILVKPSLEHCRCHPLPGSGEPRGLLEVIAPVDGHKITIFCTHFSTEESIRAEQAERVREIVQSVQGSKILCGDMNDARGSRTIAALLTDPVLMDAAAEMNAGDKGTLGVGTKRRIDFILPDLHFEVKNYQVIDSEASDHKPVLVDLDLA